jgi:hypothetical protein
VIIRDRFVISLYTGFRISDMKELTEANFADGLLTRLMKKQIKPFLSP